MPISRHEGYLPQTLKSYEDIWLLTKNYEAHKNQDRKKKKNSLKKWSNKIQMLEVYDMGF